MPAWIDSVMLAEIFHVQSVHQNIVQSLQFTLFRFGTTHRRDNVPAILCEVAGSCLARSRMKFL